MPTRHARAMLAFAGLCLSMQVFAQASEPRCHAGAYRLADGRVVDVSGNADPAKLRWRLVDGRSGLLAPEAGGAWRSTRGWTTQPDGVQVAFARCDEGRIRFEGVAGERLRFDVRETRFRGNGVELRGRLVLPAGAGPVPVAVAVHGSEDYSAVDLNHVQNLFPAHGIGVFVYDKRGTGGSSGTYTQDFHLLADDARAALIEAERLAGKRASRIGFHGGSQAGWVAPLAASKTPQARFASVGFGLAEGPLAEDREQVVLDLRRAGFDDPAVHAQAREVANAAGVVVASRGAKGWEGLDAVRTKYGEAPWWPHMKGEFTGDVVRHTRAQLEAMAPTLEKGTTWDHDPMPVLRALRVPLLWILAADDTEAPPDETRRRLQSLAAEGRPITLAQFPDTDHGMVEFETDAAGKRTPTRITDGYFRMQIDWLKDGRLQGDRYGRAEILASP
jgi:uncharacterized protein